jgi:DNA polymerase-4
MGRQESTRRITVDPLTADDTGCTILHVDMDAFFAAVELRRRPELRGQPMMVAGSVSRGVVLSATYEARAYGVRSAMPTAQALARCPGIIVLPPDHEAYHAVSGDLMALFAHVTPRVEPLSVDEAFLDVSGARRTGGRPARIAVELRARIADELGLTATIGVASTKFMAKLASSLAKPDGLLIVPPADVDDLLRPLPVRALWGVGPQTQTRLTALGLTTVGELADTDPDVLARAVGRAAALKLYELAHGRDDRAVEPGVAEASIGAESTFEVDVSDESVVLRELLDLAERAARRCRAARMLGRTVVLKVRFADFSTVTRSQTLIDPTSHGRDVYGAAVRQWRRLGVDHRAVRLVGVRLEGLVPADAVGDQLAFSEGPDRPGWRAAEDAVDRIAARFPGAAPRPATLLGPRETAAAESVRDEYDGPGRGIPPHR